MNDNFCVVGLGNHSLSKIIPALELENKNILGIVTKKNILNELNYQCFENILDAIIYLPKSTIFIISTPPTIHFDQIKLLIEHKRNIFVEKPIFVSSTNAIEIYNLLTNQNIFVIETLMYKYTKLYKSFYNYWDKSKNRIKKIECKFTIPSLPKNTFRDQNDIRSSCVYDIGCYIVSLIVDLKIKFSKIDIVKITRDKKIIKSVDFNFVNSKFTIECSIGLKKKYENSVKLQLIDDDSFFFNPFFYGRKIDKYIVEKDNNYNEKKYIIKDDDAYRNIFNIKSEIWIASQNTRFKKIIEVNKIIEDIIKKIMTL